LKARQYKPLSALNQLAAQHLARTKTASAVGILVSVGGDDRPAVPTSSTN